MHIQIASKHKLVNMGTTQLRCFQPAEYITSCGIRVTVSQLYKSIPVAGDILILHRVIFDKFTEKYIKYAKQCGVIVLYDTDDLIFSKDGIDYLKRINRNSYTKMDEVNNPYKWAMMLCDVVLVSVPYLAAQARKHHNDVRVIRNALSNSYLEVADAVYKNRSKNQKKKSVTIAYLSGSSSHDYDFKIVEPSLLELLSKDSRARILLVGSLHYSQEFLKHSKRFTHLKRVAYSEFPKLFEKIDINLIPLETDQSFCQGKSELKYIEAGACGVPSVASSTHVHEQVIDNRFNGMLVKDSEWYQAISFLIDNPGLRMRMGEQARQEVLKYYAPEKRTLEWKHLMENVKKEYGNGKKDSGFTLKTFLLRLYLEHKRFLRISKAAVRSIIRR